MAGPDAGQKRFKRRYRQDSTVYDARNKTKTLRAVSHQLPAVQQNSGRTDRHGPKRRPLRTSAELCGSNGLWMALPRLLLTQREDFAAHAVARRHRDLRRENPFRSRHQILEMNRLCHLARLTQNPARRIRL